MLKPMLASLVDAPLVDPALVYEPKYDGIRAIVEAGGRAPVRLWSRLGNEKTAQFPEIAEAIGTWARRLKAPVVLDGEIVALDAQGRPIGFQGLQGRINLGGLARRTPALAAGNRPAGGKGSRAGRGDGLPPVAFVAFDLLHSASTDWRDRPLTERRAALVRLFHRTGSPLLRLSEQVRGDGRPLRERAVREHWEGLIAKRADSRYHSGKRTTDWRKLKILQAQEFVIGGWTEPRGTRPQFGALLLGVYAGDRRSSRELVHVGKIGTGFDDRELARVMARLKPLETRHCPFREPPSTAEPAHWVKPTLVAQVKFTEWTADGRLRHPVYLGLRDDKRAEDVRRESRPQASPARAPGLTPAPAAPSVPGRRPKGRGSRPAKDITSPANTDPEAAAALIDQLQTLEKNGRDGVLDLPDGQQLAVTNLSKVFWPGRALTKGDLFRYYVRVAPFILPAIADRPLVMKRFPNGVDAKPFYQHQVTHVPEGVRLEPVTSAAKSGDRRLHIVGGSLATLMYTTQLAAISQDPWFSRVQTPLFADYVAIDLDPPDGMPFRRVLDVARFVRDELDALGAGGVPKTSGASGLHIYLPLPPGTPYEAGQLFCQIVATVVANKHPRVATVERAVSARGDRVYVDYLQNALGKTLASAYSARGSAYAGVSAPLTWEEVDKGVRREDFTISSMPARLRAVGDLWSGLRESPGVDLSRVSRYADRGSGLRA